MAEILKPVFLHGIWYVPASQQPAASSRRSKNLKFNSQFHAVPLVSQMYHLSSIIHNPSLTNSDYSFSLIELSRLSYNQRQRVDILQTFHIGSCSTFQHVVFFIRSLLIDRSTWPTVVFSKHLRNSKLPHQCTSLCESTIFRWKEITGEGIR